VLGGIRGGGCRVYFVSETAEVEVRSGGVQGPAHHAERSEEETQQGARPEDDDDHADHRPPGSLPISTIIEIRA